MKSVNVQQYPTAHKNYGIRLSSKKWLMLINFKCNNGSNLVNIYYVSGIVQMDILLCLIFLIVLPIAYIKCIIQEMKLAAN